MDERDRRSADQRAPQRHRTPAGGPRHGPHGRRARARCGRPGPRGRRERRRRVREAGGDAAWFLRERVVWPARDGLDQLGPRGQIGVFGGGGIAVAGVVAALLIAGGGSGSGARDHRGLRDPPARPGGCHRRPGPKPKKTPAKPSGPTLHGAPPEFSPAQDVRSGVGGGKAVGKEAASGATGGVGAERSAGDPTEAAPRGAGDAPGFDREDRLDPRGDASATAEAEVLSNDNAAAPPRRVAGSGQAPTGAVPTKPR